MKRLYKTIYITILLALLLTLSGCTKYSEKREIHKELYVRQEENLIIDNDFADIKVMQHDGSMIELVIVKEVTGDSRGEIKEVFKNINIDINRDKGNVIIYTSGLETIDTSVISLDVKCIVKLPRKLTNLDIKNSENNIEIIGDFEDVEVKVNKGKVTLNNIDIS